MFPVLIRDVPLVGTIYMYSLMNVLGFAVGFYLSLREGRRVGLTTGQVVDIILWAAIGGYGGARLLFIVVNWHDYLRNPMALLTLKGGLVWYGGLTVAILAIYSYCRRRGLSFAKVSDVLAPQISLGLAFGRIGCFSAGCCWGREAASDFIFAARFAHPSGQPVLNNLANVPLHPTQLYEAFGSLILFFFLLYWRSRKRFHGEVFLMYLVLYALLRSVIETFRGDGLRGYVIPEILSTSQFFALAFISAAFYYWFRRRSKAGAQIVNEKSGE